MPPPGWAPPGAYDPAYYAQAQLRHGIQVAFIGLALLIGLSFIGFHDGRYVYGPWLLGGLIPMFVGIAQVISAVLSGAQIRRRWARSPPTVALRPRRTRCRGAARRRPGAHRAAPAARPVRRLAPRPDARDREAGRAPPGLDSLGDRIAQSATAEKCRRS